MKFEISDIVAVSLGMDHQDNNETYQQALFVGYLRT